MSTLMSTTVPTTLGLLLPAFPVQAALCPAQLATRLEAELSQPPLEGAYVGILLQTQAGSPENRQDIYARYSDRRFTPASNIKLLTTAAALHHLGADYRLRTSIYGPPGAGPPGTGPLGTGEVTTLRVVGRGDPTLATAHLEALAQQLTQAGVTQVSRLVVDDSHFPGFATNPTWEWEDAQFAYAAPVNSLIVNRNAVAVQMAPTQVGQPLDITGLQTLPAGPWPVENSTLTIAAGTSPLPISLWRTGDSPRLHVTGQLAQGTAPSTYNLAVLNPAQQFAAAMERALARQSIPVAQTTITPTPLPSPGAELAAVTSPALKDLLIPANRDSDNLTAEVLLKTLGVEFSATPPAEASQAGGEAVKAVLAELGIPTEGLRIADGSGLSRHNLVTPAALVGTLQAMALHPDSQTFRSSLAVAGVSGTLRNRFQNTVLSGQVQGKSGALTGNVALSGYLQPPNYDPLVFSILINHSDQPASRLREKIDTLLLLIAQLSQQC